MKILFTLSFLLISLVIFSQKEVHKSTDDGNLTIVYHSNGKKSTEILVSNKTEYFAQGYAKAWNSKGELIYEKPVSRTALISSVFYTYYESGAVKKADYSSHPDAGIQWYRQHTYFNEDGTISSVTEESNDDRVTIGLPGETLQKELPQQYVVKRVNQDSLDFYKEYEIKSATTQITETKKSFPDKGYYEITFTKNNKPINSKIIFYKPSGVCSIERDYYPNGKLRTEKLFEKNVYHLTEYDKKGRVIKKEYNIVKTKS